MVEMEGVMSQDEVLFDRGADGYAEEVGEGWAVGAVGGWFGMHSMEVWPALWLCVGVWVCARARACVRACVRSSVNECMNACVHSSKQRLKRTHTNIPRTRTQCVHANEHASIHTGICAAPDTKEGNASSQRRPAKNKTHSAPE